MIWEMLMRCVDRAKAADSFNASWTSYLAGIATSSLIGLLTVRYTVADHQNPHGTAQAWLLAITAVTSFCAVAMLVIERRARKNRTEPLETLKKEMLEVERYFPLLDFKSEPQPIADRSGSPTQ